MKYKFMKTLSGLLFVGADQTPQDFTTPFVYKYSILGKCVLSLNKNERFGKVFKERMKVLKKMFF